MPSFFSLSLLKIIFSCCGQSEEVKQCDMVFSCGDFSNQYLGEKEFILTFDLILNIHNESLVIFRQNRADYPGIFVFH